MLAVVLQELGSCPPLALVIQFCDYWFSCLSVLCPVSYFRVRTTSSTVYPECQVQVQMCVEFDLNQWLNFNQAVEYNRKQSIVNIILVNENLYFWLKVHEGILRQIPPFLNHVMAEMGRDIRVRQTWVQVWLHSYYLFNPGQVT